jgi:hypothetical protein
MKADEKGIMDYLKQWPYSFVSGREIARKVGGKHRYEEDRGWAIPILTDLVRSGLVESDQLGHYRLKPDPKKKKARQQFIAPQLLRILKSSGKSFDSVIIDDDLDDLSPLRYRKPKTESGNRDEYTKSD